MKNSKQQPRFQNLSGWGGPNLLCQHSGEKEKEYTHFTFFPSKVYSSAAKLGTAGPSEASVNVYQANGVTSQKTLFS